MSKRAYIIYGALSGIVRRVVVPDPGEVIDIQKHLGVGEDFTFDDLPEGRIGIDVAEVMQRTKGITPLSPRCVVVDQNNDVTRVIAADPLIDTLPGVTLVRHPMADVGWKYRGGVSFDPPVRVSTASTGIPASTDIVTPPSTVVTGLNPRGG